MMQYEILAAMYADDYFAEDLVDCIRHQLQNFATAIEKSTDEQAIYLLANSCVKQINRLKPEFEEAGCALDAMAAEYIAESMMMIVQAAGFLDLDAQELMIAQEW